MNLKIKVIDSKTNEWLGWFGDEVIKLRLIIKDNIENSLLDFLDNDLGIKRENVKINKVEDNFVYVELPDIAWELFLSIVPAKN